MISDENDGISGNDIYDLISRPFFALEDMLGIPNDTDVPITMPITISLIVTALLVAYVLNKDNPKAPEIKTDPASAIIEGGASLGRIDNKIHVIS